MYAFLRWIYVCCFVWISLTLLLVAIIVRPPTLPGRRFVAAKAIACRRSRPTILSYLTFTTTMMIALALAPVSGPNGDRRNLRRISRLSSFFPSSNKLLSAASIQRSATRQHRPMIPPSNPISRISARLTMLLWSPQTRPTASFPSP